MANSADFQNALNWAIANENYDNNNQTLVDLVRKYFNENNIEYDTFSYDDLQPFLTQ